MKIFTFTEKEEWQNFVNRKPAIDSYGMQIQLGEEESIGESLNIPDELLDYLIYDIDSDQFQKLFGFSVKNISREQCAVLIADMPKEKIQILIEESGIMIESLKEDTEKGG